MNTSIYPLLSITRESADLQDLQDRLVAPLLELPDSTINEKRARDLLRPAMAPQIGIITTAEMVRFNNAFGMRPDDKEIRELGRFVAGEIAETRSKSIPDFPLSAVAATRRNAKERGGKKESNHHTLILGSHAVASSERAAGVAALGKYYDLSQSTVAKLFESEAPTGILAGYGAKRWHQEAFEHLAHTIHEAPGLIIPERALVAPASVNIVQPNGRVTSVN